MSTLLLTTLVVTQATLGFAYSLQLRDAKGADFWGKILTPNRSYYLWSALAAYVLNLGLVVHFVQDAGASAWHRAALVGGLVAYYGLQVAFLPMLRHAVSSQKKSSVRCLLAVCVLPMAVILMAGLHRAVELDVRTPRGALLAAAAVLPFAHVLVNDFILFGSRF